MPYAQVSLMKLLHYVLQANMALFGRRTDFCKEVVIPLDIGGSQESSVPLLGFRFAFTSDLIGIHKASAQHCNSFKDGWIIASSPRQALELRV